jgi:glucosamine kinase
MIDALAGTGATRICLIGGLAQPMLRWLPQAARDRLDEPVGDPLSGALLLARRAAQIG